ncbi:MAG: class I SAM-dependent methyltransferase [Anaerolineaceae bacterium]|nr:class I SAM-dependent methyltransferase [Anaerolineaceae bacterium]
MKQDNSIIEAFTEMAPDYEEIVDHELRTFWGWSYIGFIKELLGRVNIQTNDIILDIATGTGVIPEQISRSTQTKIQIIGLDITHAMINIAKQKADMQTTATKPVFTCGDAMKMPFPNACFHKILCGLATHHMNAETLVSEMKRILKPDGVITLADVGGAAFWRLPLVRELMKTATFLYFLPKEGWARAQSEADAVINVRTSEEWSMILKSNGFREVTICKLRSRFFWVPDPIIISATRV